LLSIVALSSKTSKEDVSSQESIERADGTYSKIDFKGELLTILMGFVIQGIGRPRRVIVILMEKI